MRRRLEGRRLAAAGDRRRPRLSRRARAARATDLRHDVALERPVRVRRFLLHHHERVGPLTAPHRLERRHVLRPRQPRRAHEGGGAHLAEAVPQPEADVPHERLPLGLAAQRLGRGGRVRPGPDQVRAVVHVARALGLGGQRLQRVGRAPRLVAQPLVPRRHVLDVVARGAVGVVVLVGGDAEQSGHGVAAQVGHGGAEALRVAAGRGEGDGSLHPLAAPVQQPRHQHQPALLVGGDRLEQHQPLRRQHRPRHVQDLVERRVAEGVLAAPARADLHRAVARRVPQLGKRGHQRERDLAGLGALARDADRVRRRAVPVRVGGRLADDFVHDMFPLSSVQQADRAS
ncbi:MAG: hypothetical protein AVDCRST_MAG04-2270 [uncultured Acetobacteraceae bacterium]|uniref:Uncharacterized protein n=1 Tax=uncultured Acetobacteraceae bacterium TaxID=169975 RepID=A0A6J4IMQ6_9PROT|nr:MAG: hypothetical protein AVDCRST_MAG04-2270 [uncultured Acetobacteraceae bacterium]